LATDQRSVADWPRSMFRGSAVKLLIRGAKAAGGGGGSGAGAGAGGGGATGAFFPHPADTINRVVNTAALSVL
jgi:hypothetical protein